MINTLVFSSIQTSLGSNTYYLFPQRSVNLSLGILSRLKHFVPTDTLNLLSIYRFLFSPTWCMVVLYGAKLLKQIWTNHWSCKTCSSFNSLCSIQISCDPATATNIISSHWAFNAASQFALFYIHDVSNNSLLPNISKLFLNPTQGHSYNTRFPES